MKKALEDIRVIDLSHVLAAPTATMFLADIDGTCLRCPIPLGWRHLAARYPHTILDSRFRGNDEILNISSPV
jgi:hypothetical protein